MLNDDSIEWRPIQGFRGFYDVSNNGLVRSHPRRYAVQRNGSTFMQSRTGQLMKLRKRPNGYMEVRLRAKSRGVANRAFLVHSLVLEAFVGKRPPGMQACHNDCDKTNNRVSNLRWDTPAANIQDSVRNGTHAGMRKTHCPAGHPYNESNTYRHPTNGHRCCRACGRARHHVIQARKPKPLPQSHCKRGHEFTEANTYWSGGKRACRRCCLDRAKERRTESKAA